MVYDNFEDILKKIKEYKTLQEKIDYLKKLRRDIQLDPYFTLSMKLQPGEMKMIPTGAVVTDSLKEMLRKINVELENLENISKSKPNEESSKLGICEAVDWINNSIKPEYLYNELKKSNLIDASTKKEEFEAIFSGNENQVIPLKWKGNRIQLVKLFELLRCKFKLISSSTRRNKFSKLFLYKNMINKKWEYYSTVGLNQAATEIKDIKDANEDNESLNIVFEAVKKAISNNHRG